MSILIAYKKGDAIYMATDTRVIVDEEKRNELCECNYKIQKLDNGMLVGITGQRMERQTIFANSHIFTLDKNNSLTRKHIVKEIIPALLSILDRESLLRECEDETPYMKAIIMLAHKDVVYEICSSFSIVRYEDFQALGRASESAQAVLVNTKESDDINERLIRTLDVVANNSPLVGRPYLLIDTKDQEYKIIRRND